MNPGQDPGVKPAAEWLAPWVQQWGDRLVQFAYTYTRQPESAQDIAQETFLRLYRWRSAHPDRPVTPGGLYTVAARIAIDSVRRERNTVPTVGMNGPSQDPTGDWDRALLVRGAVDRLPARDRECVWLFYYAEWSIAEVAAAPHQTPAAVKQRPFRVRKHLTRLIGGDKDG